MCCRLWVFFSAVSRFWARPFHKLKPYMHIHSVGFAFETLISCHVLVSDMIAILLLSLHFYIFFSQAPFGLQFVVAVVVVFLFVFITCALSNVQDRVVCREHIPFEKKTSSPESSTNKQILTSTLVHNTCIRMLWMWIQAKKRKSQRYFNGFNHFHDAKKLYESSFFFRFIYQLFTALFRIRREPNTHQMKTTNKYVFWVEIHLQ